MVHHATRKSNCGGTLLQLKSNVITRKYSVKVAHLSIFYTFLIRLRILGGEAYPVHHRATQKQTTTLTPSVNIESPINHKCTFLGNGRKPEYPERTHTYTLRTWKLHKLPVDPYNYQNREETQPMKRKEKLNVIPK